MTRLERICYSLRDEGVSEKKAMKMSRFELNDLLYEDIDIETLKDLRNHIDCVGYPID